MGKFGKQLAETVINTAAGGVGSAIGGLVGMAFQGANDRRQVRQQRRLQDLEMEGQRQMTDYNFKKQMELWEQTGYGAQKDQMKEAGLNPALMYGMGGGGGQSTNVETGHVTGASAPQGGGEIGMGMQMGMQVQLMEAQRKVLESQANLNNVEATKKSGVDTENVAANTAITKVQTQIAELDKDMATDSYKSRRARIDYETNKAMAEMQVLQNESLLTGNTWLLEIEKVQTELIGLQLKNELTKAQTGKTWSDIEVNKAQIQNWVTQNAQGWGKLTVDQRNARVNELLAEFNTSLSREAIGAVGGIISTILSKGMSKAPVGGKPISINVQR